MYEIGQHGNIICIEWITINRKARFQCNACRICPLRRRIRDTIDPNVQIMKHTIYIEWVNINNAARLQLRSG